MSVNSGQNPVELLGLDVGNARIGVARANSIAKIPQALAVVPTSDAVKRIAQLAKTTGSEQIIIGLPLQPDGNEGEQSKAVREFAAALKVELPLPQTFIDESYSSLEADAYITKQEPGVQLNDDIAACIVLERYLSGAQSV